MRNLTDITDNEIVDAIAGFGMHGYDVEDDESTEQIAEDLDVSPVELDERFVERIEQLIRLEDLWDLPNGDIAPSASSWARILTARLNASWLRVPAEERESRITDILQGRL